MIITILSIFAIIIAILAIILTIEFIITIGINIYHNIQKEKREADLHNHKYHYFD